MLDSVDDPGDSADADSPDASPLTWPSANRILASTCVVLVVLASVVAVSEAFGAAAHSSEVHVPCFPLTLAHYGGDRACSRSRPCPVGAGDCDADSACRASLYCFKREQGEAVPGVNVTNIPDHADVCYDPALVMPGSPAREPQQPSSPHAHVARCSLHVSLISVITT